MTWEKLLDAMSKEFFIERRLCSEEFRKHVETFHRPDDESSVGRGDLNILIKKIQRRYPGVSLFCHSYRVTLEDGEDPVEGRAMALILQHNVSCKELMKSTALKDPTFKDEIKKKNKNEDVVLHECLVLLKHGRKFSLRSRDALKMDFEFLKSIGKLIVNLFDAFSGEKKDSIDVQLDEDEKLLWDVEAGREEKDTEKILIYRSSKTTEPILNFKMNGIFRKCFALSS